MEHATEIYGNYAVAGLICISFGATLIRLSLPVFIPLKGIALLLLELVHSAEQ